MLAATNIYVFPADDTFVEKWETTNDSHFVLRETPPQAVRERWMKIRLYVHEKELQQELLMLRVEEQVDDSLLPLPPKLLTWWGNIVYHVGTIICHWFHYDPVYKVGDQYATCMCGRKYAMPWADPSKLEADVHRCADVFVKPNAPTYQALCRNGLFGDC
jgi:hypothetical protein